MIKIEETETYGWEAAIRGMRNPMNSWDKSDSAFGRNLAIPYAQNNPSIWFNKYGVEMYIGDNDLDLMHRLCVAGTDHRKFMRMIVVYCDITAPLYWWKEFDTYKVGTVANSCSTMHKIHAKEFTIDDFSYEHLVEEANDCEIGVYWGTDGVSEIEPKDLLELTIEGLNKYRNAYLETKDKKYWWQMIQLLPSSYNQKRTVMMNYEVLNNIYTSRRTHKLNEWRDFCDWAKTLPHSKLITKQSDITDDFWEITRSCFEPTDEPIARAILTGEQMPEAKVVYKDALSEK
jgi:hypothetical protein|uniref:Uncharacterized protein n=1 Tax=Siphoviridae sp. ctMsr1 TaxID=2826264 RepID=A0A8S5LUX1_9CAUD|nr:MAG TPA: hypothetical protein [Siphoviridae sp. ctMsr1]